MESCLLFLQYAGSEVDLVKIVGSVWLVVTRNQIVFDGSRGMVIVLDVK